MFEHKNGSQVLHFFFKIPQELKWHERYLKSQIEKCWIHEEKYLNQPWNRQESTLYKQCYTFQFLAHRILYVKFNRDCGYYEFITLSVITTYLIGSPFVILCVIGCKPLSRDTDVGIGPLSVGVGKQTVHSARCGNTNQLTKTSTILKWRLRNQ